MIDISNAYSERRVAIKFDLVNGGCMRRVQSPRRTSIMPPSQLDITRRHETEGNANEIPLLYDKYLQALMTEHVLKIKETEREKIILTQLASLEQKNEECDMKLHEIKMRINELEPLNTMQQYWETQIQEVETFLEASQAKVTGTLNKIHSNLKSFDKLACENVIIPTTIEDLKIMHNSLSKCNELLDSINCVLGDQSTAMISTNDYLKKFGELLSITEKLMKEMHNNLEHIQIDILKKGSATMNAIDV